MWVIVPIKRFSAAKQRLSAAASAAQRVELTKSMAQRVLVELGKSAVIGGVCVVSGEASLQRFVCDLGFDFVADPDLGLNEAIAVATRGLDGEQADDVAIVHADLPLFRAGEFDRIAALHRAGGDRKMTIVKDIARDGTTLRFCRPGRSVPPLFGQNSAIRHARYAQANGLEVEVLSSPTLSLDCDTPEDVERILHLAALSGEILPDVSLFRSGQLQQEKGALP